MYDCSAGTRHGLRLFASLRGLRGCRVGHAILVTNWQVESSEKEGVREGGDVTIGGGGEWGGSDGLAEQGHPPTRPFDSAQVERPHPAGWIHDPPKSDFQLGAPSARGGAREGRGVGPIWIIEGRLM